MNTFMNTLLLALILFLAVMFGRMAHAETLSNGFHVTEVEPKVCSCDRILYLDTWLEVLFGALFPPPPGFYAPKISNRNMQRMLLQILEGRFQGNVLTNGVGFYTPVTMDNGMQ